MDTKMFIDGLFALKEDGSKMSAFKRLYQVNSSSRFKGLAILARMGVRVSNQNEAAPYVGTACLFSILKGESGYDLPIAFKKAILQDNPDESQESPFDKRFERMLAASNVDSLFKYHIMRNVNLLKDHNIGIDYGHLLYDLHHWNESGTRNRWINQYFS